MSGPNTDTLAFGVDQNHDVVMFNNSGSAYATFDGSTSRVGIGTTSPGAKLDIESTGVASIPTVEITNTSSSTFNHSINAFAPNLTAGENNIFIIGRSGSSKNAGYIGYKYSSAGSNANLLTFGHWASDNLMNLTGDGLLGIGTTAPTALLEVRGDSQPLAMFSGSSYTIEFDHAGQEKFDISHGSSGLFFRKSMILF